MLPFSVRCGTLIDGVTSDRRRNVVVDIQDGRIARLSGAGPAEASSVVDWSRYTVLPGLIDAHDHLTLDLGDEELQSRETDAWTALKAAGTAARILASGITTLRDCGARRHIDVQIRQALAAAVIRGPRVLVSGVPLTVTGGQCWFLGGEVDTPADMRRLIRQQVKAGVDWIKVFVTGGVATKGANLLRAAFSAEDLRAIVEEAHEAERRVVAHCHGGAGARWAAEAGVDTLEHGVFFTRDDLTLLADRGIPLVITYGVYERGARSTEVPPFFRDKCVEVMGRYLETIAAAREAGVRIAVGTDTVHADLVAELRALTMAGYSTFEALLACTRWAAEALGLAQLGTVAPGKIADLVAVDGDPLTDVEAIGRVRGVIQNGTLIA